MALAATTSDLHNPNNGYIVPQPPDDTVSRLRFSPENSPSTFLLASSWNGSVRLWKVDSPTGPASGVAEVKFEHPVIDATWAADGRAAFVSVTDNFVSRWDLESNNRTVVAAHDAPARQCIDNPQVGYLATASWDHSLRYWDVRAPTGKPMAVVPLAERAYGMDSLGYLMVVAMAARRVAVFDVRKPTTPFQEKYSQLKHQSRCVACWPDAMGYVIACVDGTVSVDYVQQPRPDYNGVFTCHRDRGGPFSINAVRFNPHTGAFATAASDGHVFFWDKDRLERARARKFERMRAPVCDVDFYHNGSMYAYAVGYDWNQGSEGNNFSPENNYIVLQAIHEGDITVKTHSQQGPSRGRGRNRRRGHSGRS